MLDCRDIPVRVIALSNDKYAQAEKRIADACDFRDVRRWHGVRGRDLFDDATRRLLPNYRDIVAQKYPHLMLPAGEFLSVQTQLVLETQERTNIYDMHNCGAVGCALSHISIWQYIVRNSIAAMIVFEDDVEFDAAFLEKTSVCKELNDLLAKFALDFDVFNLNLALIPKNLIHNTELRPTTAKNVVRVQGIAFRAQGYLITLEGARTLLRNAFPLLHVVDAYMSMHTMLHASNNDFLFLAAKKPILIHPPMDFASSQIGYSRWTTLCDGIMFVPRNVTLSALVGVFVVSLIVAIVFIVVNVRLASKLKNAKSLLVKTSKKRGDYDFKKRRRKNE